MATKIHTITMMLGELVQEHMDTCDAAAAEHPEDDMPEHVIDPVEQTSANIDQLVIDHEGILILNLSDGTSWSVVISERT